MSPYKIAEAMIVEGDNFTVSLVDHHGKPLLIMFCRDRNTQMLTARDAIVGLVMALSSERELAHKTSKAASGLRGIDEAVLAEIRVNTAYALRHIDDFKMTDGIRIVLERYVLELLAYADMKEVGP